MKNDKLPIRFIKKEPRKITKWIILHSQKCQLNFKDNQLTQEMPTYQTGKLKNIAIVMEHNDFIPYHYVVELVGRDYVVQVTAPEHYYIEYDDISDRYKYQIHIQIMGDFNYINLTDRLSMSLQYYLLNPLLYRYGLQPNRIKLHSEVQEEQDGILSCPGAFFKTDKLMSFVKKFYRTGSL